MKNIIIKLFNLEPDDIKEIDVLSKGLEVFVFITLSIRMHLCPNCNSPTTRVKDYYDKTIAHPILNGINTTIIYHRRRLFCPHCGSSFMEEKPSSSKRLRMSASSTGPMANMPSDGYWPQISRTSSTASI